MEADFRANIVAKQEVFKNHKEEVDHVTKRVNRHRVDINEMSIDMRMVLKRLDKLEKRALEQQETIDALEGIVENQQTWITRIRSCHCNEGADNS